MTSSPRRLVDLSHTVEHGLVTYPGLPAPIICDFLSRERSRELYAPGTEFNIGKIEMVANTGTYVDSPFHRFADGADLSELPLERLAGVEGVVIEARDRRGASLDRSLFEKVDVAGRAVIVRTGWAEHFATPKYFQGHPFLTRDAAELLVARGAAIVGIDSLNIDDTADKARPAHTVLLGAQIPIVEHLRGLEQLAGDAFRFFATPVKVKGFGTFPVRAFAELDR